MICVCLVCEDVIIISNSVLFEWSAVLFMVSSGHICRQVVGRRSQVQTPTLFNPFRSPALSTPTCFSSFLLSSKMSKIFQLSLSTSYSSSLSCNAPETTFSLSSTPLSYLVLVRTWLLLYYRASLFFFPWFVKHTAAHKYIAFCSLDVSIFIPCCFRPENAYICVKFLMRKFPVRSLFHVCPPIAVLVKTVLRCQDL